MPNNSIWGDRPMSGILALPSGPAPGTAPTIAVGTVPHATSSPGTAIVAAQARAAEAEQAQVAAQAQYTAQLRAWHRDMSARRVAARARYIRAQTRLLGGALRMAMWGFGIGVVVRLLAWLGRPRPVPPALPAAQPRRTP